MAYKGFDKFEDKRKKRWWLVLITIFLILILAFTSLTFGLQSVFADKIYPGVKIGYLDVGNLTPDEALTQLKKIEENISSQGLRFISSDKEISIAPIVITAADPDLAKPILTFDWQKIVDEAYQIGRADNWPQNLGVQLKTIFFGNQVSPIYHLDQEELSAVLKTNFSKLEKPPVNAQLVIKDDQVEVIGEQSGYIFDYEKAVEQLVKNVELLDFSPITLDLVFTEPEIKKEHTGSAFNSLEKILAIDSIKLLVSPYWWKINKFDFIDWLEFQLIAGEVVVGFNQDKVFEFLKPIADKINVQVQDAKFKLSGKRVIEFQASQDGKTLNLEKSYQKINSQIVRGEASDIDLVVEVTPTKVATGDVNDLGIKESIGVGSSNFKGSPKNRRHNIAVGAATLNGILIAPGEEFSLLNALGPVDGDHGYKQELVIKGDRTIPEYGGGLCQIGTTTFRAALRSGLPITMRQPHSYRVVYYEPAGMDATIYNPYPDMKFINDTGVHILFTTRIEGDNLIFEFFGTKDGRKVSIEPDPPSIYNVTSPGEPRYIETEELKPGEKKIAEHSHKGADTYFKYVVTYPNGEVKEQDFASHYVAWPEVWLVGKEPSATSTEATVSELLETGPQIQNN